MDLNFIIYTLFWYSYVQAHNYTDAELTKALVELGKTSNKECLRVSAVILAAIAAGEQSKLIDVPDKPIEAKDVHFVLFTQLNPTSPQNLSATDINSLRRSHYDKKKRTFIYLHGSMDSYKGARATAIVRELSKCFNINIIIVDWSSYSRRNLTYTRNVTTPLVGKICGRFVKLLIRYGVSANQLHLAGHSTGAQAAGFCAKAVETIPRITAMDPVGPCYVLQPPWNRLAKTDAFCVQIIHCSVGNRGVWLNYTGTIDFYIQGGVYQRQCYGNDLDQVSLCSHNACIDYFIRALTNFQQFFGIKCKNYKEYTKKNCDYTEIAIGGFYATCSKPGSYFVDVCPFSHINWYDLQYHY